MASEQSHLTIRRSDTVSIVEFADRKILEEISIAEIGEELSSLVDSEPEAKILLSFKNVEHLSSAALGMLITLDKKIKELNGRLVLSEISPQIYEVFKITQLNKLFNIYETTERALNTF